MTPDTLARAFDPFFTTKPIGQGTGLGLSMIYGFAQQSGGHVRLRSAPGQGTTAMLYLPRHLGRRRARRMRRLQAGRLRQETARWCWPSRTSRPCAWSSWTCFRSRPHGAGSRRRTVRTRRRGVGRAHRPAADRCRPAWRHERPQLADAARQRRPGLKVLFVTGYADAAATGNGLLDAGMEVMTKPFAVDALAAKVQGIISH